MEAYFVDLYAQRENILYLRFKPMYESCFPGWDEKWVEKNGDKDKKQNYGKDYLAHREILSVYWILRNILKSHILKI